MHVYLLLLYRLILSRGHLSKYYNKFKDVVYGKLWKLNILIIIYEGLTSLMTYITYTKIEMYQKDTTQFKEEDLKRWGIKTEDIIVDRKGNVLEWETFKNKMKVLMTRPRF